MRTPVGVTMAATLSFGAQQPMWIYSNVRRYEAGPERKDKDDEEERIERITIPSDDVGSTVSRQLLQRDGVWRSTSTVAS